MELLSIFHFRFYWCYSLEEPHPSLGSLGFVFSWLLPLLSVAGGWWLLAAGWFFVYGCEIRKLNLAQVEDWPAPCRISAGLSYAHVIILKARNVTIFAIFMHLSSVENVSAGMRILMPNANPKESNRISQTLLPICWMVFSLGHWVFPAARWEKI